MSETLNNNKNMCIKEHQKERESIKYTYIKRIKGKIRKRLLLK